MEVNVYYAVEAGLSCTKDPCGYAAPKYLDASGWPHPAEEGVSSMKRADFPSPACRGVNVWKVGNCGTREGLGQEWDGWLGIL